MHSYMLLLCTAALYVLQNHTPVFGQGYEDVVWGMKFVMFWGIIICTVVCKVCR